VSNLRILGRSSSHFTRTVRVFAAELGSEYTFVPLSDMMSQRAADYAGNPALKLPILETEQGAWFGTLSICRELARRSSRPLRIVWPEDLQQPSTANAQELVLQGMASEVTLIMATASSPDRSGPYEAKIRTGLTTTLDWLERELPEVLSKLEPDRALSFLEVTLFCFVTHLPFRNVIDTAKYAQLRAFCEHFAQRRSASSTEYRFDTA
jgi:glutathione S-transferase